MSSLLSVHGVEQRADDVEEFRLVGLDDHGDHLAVEVGGGVIRGDQGLELLQPVLVVEELAAFGDVCAQVLVGQSQVRPAGWTPGRHGSAAVEANVQQPVVFVVRFFGMASRAEICRRVHHVRCESWLPAPRLDPAAEPQRHREHLLVHVSQELAVGVVPEHDPLPFLR